ncbi:MAG: hypothetical protein RL748_1824 [Pseudomonadota bacterium]
MFANESRIPDTQGLSSASPDKSASNKKLPTLSEMTGKMLFEREPYLRQVIITPDSKAGDTMVTIEDFFPEEPVLVP